MCLIRKRLESMYLDFFNNYLTVSSFALDYGYSNSKALRILRIGQRINWSGDAENNTLFIVR